MLTFASTTDLALHVRPRSAGKQEPGLLGRHAWPSSGSPPVRKCLRPWVASSAPDYSNVAAPAGKGQVAPAEQSAQARPADSRPLGPHSNSPRVELYSWGRPAYPASKQMGSCLSRAAGAARCCCDEPERQPMGGPTGADATGSRGCRRMPCRPQRQKASHRVWILPDLRKGEKPGRGVLVKAGMQPCRRVHTRSVPQQTVGPLDLI